MFSRSVTMTMRVLFRLVNIVMAALFVVAAAVQYNDPDPLRWIALYLAAAAACVASLRRRPSPAPPAVVLAAALAWAAWTAPRAAGVRLSEMTAGWKMEGAAVEAARETGGLLLVAAWMGVLAAVSLSRRRSARPSTEAPNAALG